MNSSMHLGMIQRRLGNAQAQFTNVVAEFVRILFVLAIAKFSSFGAQCSFRTHCLSNSFSQRLRNYDAFQDGFPW
jgi:hypothetical protein